MAQNPSDSKKYVCFRRTKKNYFEGVFTYCQLLLFGVIHYTWSDSAASNSRIIST